MHRLATYNFVIEFMIASFFNVMNKSIHLTSNDLKLQKSHSDQSIQYFQFLQDKISDMAQSLNMTQDHQYKTHVLEISHLFSASHKINQQHKTQSHTTNDTMEIFLKIIMYHPNDSI